jgi:hypothetical protein
MCQNLDLRFLFYCLFMLDFLFAFFVFQFFIAFSPFFTFVFLLLFFPSPPFSSLFLSMFFRLSGRASSMAGYGVRHTSARPNKHNSIENKN